MSRGSSDELAIWTWRGGASLCLPVSVSPSHMFTPPPPVLVTTTTLSFAFSSLRRGITCYSRFTLVHSVKGDGRARRARRESLVLVMCTEDAARASDRPASFNDGRRALTSQLLLCYQQIIVVAGVWCRNYRRARTTPLLHSHGHY